MVRWRGAVVCVVLTAMAAAAVPTSCSDDPDALDGAEGALVEDFAGPDGLITNEYAHWNPEDPRGVRSPDWDVTAGSLFRHDGTGWSGPPDTVSPDASSSNGTGSATFRMTSRRVFTDPSVRFRLRIDAEDAPSGGDTAWAGVHVFLRHRGEAELYVASVFRRDGTVAIKKKMPGGAANGGTYVTLGTARAPMTIGQWHDVAVDLIDENGNPRIAMSIDGRRALSAEDSDRGGPPIPGPGNVGLRGDRTGFRVDDIRIDER